MNTTIESLLGKTLTNIEISDALDSVIFTTLEGDRYQMYHSQDCCETVTIDDINGDIVDLLNSPITLASERTSRESFNSEKEYESFLWTFYTLATVKGYVDIRWVGNSNGYYSESVDFIKLTPSL